MFNTLEILFFKSTLSKTKTKKVIPILVEQRIFPDPIPQRVFQQNSKNKEFYIDNISE